MQDKSGEQKNHHDRNNLLEQLTDAFRNTSQDTTKTITGTSIKNNKVLENLNEKSLDLMNEKGMIAHTLAASLAKLFKPENKSQIRFKKDLNSTRMKDFLINGGTPVSIYDNMVTFRDSYKSFKLDGDLLETRKNFGFDVSKSNPKDQKLIYEFGKKMNFNIRQQGRRSDRDKSMTICAHSFKSPAIMVSGVTTLFLPKTKS